MELVDILMEAGIRAKDHRYVRSTPNNLGEALRNWAFTEPVGAHNCFTVREGFKEVEFGARELKLLFPSSSTDLEEMQQGRWFVHGGIEVGWLHHIGTNEYSLVFYIPELADKNMTGVLKTNNSSKDYMWYFQEKR